jgi:hypothetical protein
MANLSLREAVKHFDVSRPTLQKALKSGKISGVQDGQGHWTIDPAELARVYTGRESHPVKVDHHLPAKLATENTPLASEIEALKLRLSEAEQRAAVAEALAAERGQHLEDLRRLLPAPSSTSQRRGWWLWRRT